MLWWLDEPLLRGSHNPTDAELTELSRQGVITVVSLLSEETPAYRAACVESLGLETYSVPVRDFAAPTVKQFYQVLEIVRLRFRQGGILIHCQGGHGRTGTVAAAYWISKGLSLEEAVRKVRRANPAAIETQEQEESLYELAADFDKRRLTLNDEQTPRD